MLTWFKQRKKKEMALETTGNNGMRAKTAVKIAFGTKTSVTLDVADKIAATSKFVET